MSMYSVDVPKGLTEGQQFNAELGGTTMLVTVPPGYSGGMSLQLKGPAAMPVVQGTAVVGGGSFKTGVFDCFDHCGEGGGSVCACLTGMCCSYIAVPQVAIRSSIEPS